MPTRRQSADDACPGALRLHAAADGALARVRLPGGMLTGHQLGVLADIARQHGDGALELTSRANIQLRALRADPTELAGRLAAAGLLPSLAHETVRNIAAPPLADAETRGLVEELDHALCADDTLATLPGRFLFAIGRTSLAADVAAIPVLDGPLFDDRVLDDPNPHSPNPHSPTPDSPIIDSPITDRRVLSGPVIDGHGPADATPDSPTANGPAIDSQEPADATPNNPTPNSPAIDGRGPDGATPDGATPGGPVPRRPRSSGSPDGRGPADATSRPPGWVILLGGADVGLRVTTDQVVETMLGAARGFLAERAGREPKPWRLREIPGGPELVAARLEKITSGPGPAAPQREEAPGGAEPGARPRPRPEALGAAQAGSQPPSAQAATGDAGAGPLVGRLGESAVGVLVPLGRLTRVQLKVLAQAERLAVAPWGGVVVLDLAPTAVDRWVRELGEAGLVTEGDSKWVGVTTCAGRPGCGKALADVRGDAEQAARFVDGRPVHWVGCERGCGSPAGRHVRVEASADGYLVDGKPVGSRDLGEVVAARRA